MRTDLSHKLVGFIRLAAAYSKSTISFNPSSAGVEGGYYPCRICVINHEPRKLSTPNVQYLRLYQLDTCCESFVEVCRKIVETWQFYDVTKRDFRAKSGQYSNGHFSFTYQALLNCKISQDVEC